MNFEIFVNHMLTPNKSPPMMPSPTWDQEMAQPPPKSQEAKMSSPGGAHQAGGPSYVNVG